MLKNGKLPLGHHYLIGLVGNEGGFCERGNGKNYEEKKFFLFVTFAASLLFVETGVKTENHRGWEIIGLCLPGQVPTTNSEID